MNAEATKRVNELIVKLCDYIEKAMESDSAAAHEQLPSLVGALAMLINLQISR
ncbi:hypothetical protein [Paenibacillus thiaminolyticus]|uniref:hypothetical protein n=1 Tax=Paenibacillus thiaminolyticus TaxID=49283 RepID=UPI002542704E|nr:hypothetical protein [Paenibacillus thiaminolyticus]WII39159.1 hypothetical protein O0V01_08760 [Paenibacillus thiaminolyticus]